MYATRFILAAWLVVITSSSFADAQSDAIVGVWLTEQADSKIEIGKTASGYAGKVVWLKEAGNRPTDAKNADPALRSRPIIGVEVVSGVVYNGQGVWRGSLYSPRKGRSYPAELSLEGGKLMVKAKDGIFSKTVAWTRQQ